MRTSPFVKRGYSASSSVSCFITSASCLSNLSRSDWVGFFPFVPSIKSIILNRSAFRISLLSITSCSVDTSSPLSQFPHYLFSPLANIELTFYNCSILKGGYMTIRAIYNPYLASTLLIMSAPLGVSISTPASDIYPSASSHASANIRRLSGGNSDNHTDTGTTGADNPKTE